MIEGIKELLKKMGCSIINNVEEYLKGIYQEGYDDGYRDGQKSNKVKKKKKKVV